ncbi:hypothetical protein HY250_02370 [Candidatus Azambacteria bacterium]|nr:hypothetical protein [Candidatus Azambacteria bacterium]
MIGRIKELWGEHDSRISHVAEILLVAVIFFGLGALYVERIVYPRPPIVVAKLENGYVRAAPVKLIDAENISPQLRPEPKQQASVSKGEYVASRYGKTYYRVTCANQIKEENKIFFNTEEDAKKAGLTLAKSCTK